MVSQMQYKFLSGDMESKALRRYTLYLNSQGTQKLPLEYKEVQLQEGFGGLTKNQNGKEKNFYGIRIILPKFSSQKVSILAPFWLPSTCLGRFHQLNFLGRRSFHELNPPAAVCTQRVLFLLLMKVPNNTLAVFQL